ncbi:MAG: hypothetical protein J6T52_08810 [Bacteroidaceae bacterium]|nr:hypothetical protein [Bacteroidaceae bacterium]
MNTAIFAINPRLKSSTTGKVMGQYHRGYAEPATAEQVLTMITREDVRQMVERIRGGEEALKDELPTVCPHYAQFQNNHRAQADIMPETFTFKTCVDVDDREKVAQAIQRAQVVNTDPLSDWEGMVECIERSPRMKVHIWIRLPKGMTIREAQEEFCQEIGVPFDESCITPERYINMTGDIIYRSERWLQTLSDDEIKERREAYLQRGLDVDGRPLKPVEAKNTAASGKAASSTAYSDEVVAANERTRFIMRECLKEAGLQQSDFTDEGGRHNAVKSALSVGATQLMTIGEVYGVLQELMPEHWQDKNIRQLVTDFYAKYHEDSQKLTQFQRRVFSQSMRLGSVSANTAESKDEKPAEVYGDTAPLSVIYGSKRPPLMPECLPRFVKAVTSKTPNTMKPTVAQGMFPPVSVYPRKLSFEYIDGQYRELRCNCLTIAGTGSGKDTCLKQPIKHLIAPMAARDAVNRQRLKEFNEQYNSTANSKQKPQRPDDLCIQYVSANLTAARLAQLMDDSQGAFLYAHLHEFEQWYGVEGKTGNNCTFQNLKLADDEDNPFGQERAGAQSVNYMGSLGLNWNASTTPSRAQQMFRSVLIDGPISRVCLATTPDVGLGAPIPVYGRYDQKYDDALRPYIDNLMTATGEQTCKQACRLIERLKAECDQFTQQTQDEVFDNLNHRALVHAFRKACLLYAANGFKWEKAIESFCRWSLHYDLWLKLHFFGDLIRKADSQTQTSRRGPRNLLELLPDTFTRQDAISVRQQAGKNSEGTGNMLSQWVHRGYILQMTDDSYKKASSEKK